VDPADRLAAYLAGELDAAEHAAVAAALARDPALRADLAALERADGAMAALRSPQPPDGFEQRLEQAVARELGAVLGTPGPARGSGHTSSRRTVPRGAGAARRHRLLPALGGVAASLVVLLAGIGIVGSLVGEDGDDGDQLAGATEADDVTTTTDGEGPTVVALDRTLAPEDVDALLDAPALTALASSEPGRADGEALARRWAEQLHADYGTSALGPRAPGDVPAADDADASVGAEAADGGRPADDAGGAEPIEEATDDAGPADEQEDGPPDVEAAVGACLGRLLGPDDPAIPAYVELLTYRGRPAIAYGLVVPDPPSGRYTAREVWVLDRADCAVLRATVP
jgi:anti-sigma factor RsiW